MLAVLVLLMVPPPNSNINSTANEHKKIANNVIAHNVIENVIENETSNNTHTLENKLTHVWYRNWPDNGVPEDMVKFHVFIDRLYDDIYKKNFFKLEHDDTIIIHCNSGAGSSGIVLIILQLKQLKDEYRKIITDQIILNEIIDARKYRMSLVYTLEQFVFICKFFSINEDDDVMKKYKDTIVSYKSLQKGESEPLFDPHSYITKTHASHASLVAQGSLTTEDAFLQKNKDLNTNPNTNPNTKPNPNPKRNRYINIVPYDHNRVKLTLVGEQTNDYINASHMQNINIDSKDIKIILAQGPHTHTVQDFLRMCIEQKVRLIIMLTGLTKGDEDNGADYMESAGEFSLLNINNKNHIKEYCLYTEYNLQNNKEQFSSTGTSTITQGQLIQEEQEQQKEKAKLLEEEKKKQLYQETITNLSNIDENIRLKVLEYLNNELHNKKTHKINVEDFFNNVMFNTTHFKKISASSNPQAEKNALNEGIKNGRQNLLDLLKNPLEAILYNIDLNVKSQIIQHIDTMNNTKNPVQNISNAEINLFSTFIDELYTDILKSQDEQLTLNNALTSYELTELIDMLTQSKKSALLRNTSS